MDSRDPLRASPPRTLRKVQKRADSQNRLLALQQAAGNQAVAGLISSRERRPVQRSDDGPIPLAGVLDNGVISDMTLAEMKGKRKGVLLFEGTYVEVIGKPSGDDFAVRVYSGYHGQIATIPQSSFRHEPQLDVTRKHEERWAKSHTPDDLAFRRPRNVSLWAADGPRYDDVKQGTLGDCWLLSTAAALALANPNTIKALFPDQRPDQDAYPVRVHRMRNGTVVTENIIVSSALAEEVKHGRRQYGHHEYAKVSPDKVLRRNCLWVALLEKAMAELLGGFDDLSEGGSARNASTAYLALTGKVQTDLDVEAGPGEKAPERMNDQRLLQTLHDAVHVRRQSVTVGTKGKSDKEYLDKSIPLVANHQYAVVRLDLITGRIILFNPWGREHPRPLTPAEIKSNFDEFLYGHRPASASS